MSSLPDRAFIRTLHLVLSIPIIGFIYGPVHHIPPATAFTRFIAVPLVIMSGIWMWQAAPLALAAPAQGKVSHRTLFSQQNTQADRRERKGFEQK